MRPIAVFLFPNMRSVSITLQELLDVDASIKTAVSTMTSLYGTPRLLPIAERISFPDLLKLVENAGLSVQKAAA